MQPSGTVTFLFSDIEGSTRLLGAIGTDRYERVLEDHRQLLRGAFDAYAGYEVSTAGDSFFVAFNRAQDAVGAALAGQRALARHAWADGERVRVRMGIHTTEATPSGRDYVGLGVHRAARISAAAHGDQVLVSQSTRDLLDDDPEIRCDDLGDAPAQGLPAAAAALPAGRPGASERFPPVAHAAESPDQPDAASHTPCRQGT
jgi:class 3 adenylate cyclase